MEPPIDKGWAWVALIGVWISCFFMVGGLKSTGILFVEFIRMYDAPFSLTALAMGLIMLTMSITSPVACALGERYSYRIVVTVGGVFMTVAPIIAVLQENIYVLIFLFGPVTGMGYGSVFIPSMVVVSKYFEKKRTLATGIAVSGSAVGQLLIPQIIRLLIDAYATRGALLVFAGLNLNVVVGAALFRPFSFYTKKRSSNYETMEKEITLHKVLAPLPCFTEECQKRFSTQSDAQDTELQKQEQNITPNGSVVELNEKPADNGTKGDRNGDVVKEKNKNQNLDVSNDNRGDECTTETRPFIIEEAMKPEPIEIKPEATREGCSAFCVKCCKSNSDRPPLFDCSVLKLWVFRTYLAGIVTSYFGYINPILFVPAFAQDQGVSSFHQALLVSIMGVADFAGRLFIGWLGNLNVIKRSWILACSQVISGVILIICTIFHSYASAMVICLSHGAIAGALFSLFSVVLVDFIGKERISAGLGLTYFCMSFSQTPMPSLLGLFRDKTGTYNYAFYVCGTVAILGTVFYLLEPCARRMDERRAAIESRRSTKASVRSTDQPNV